MAKNEAEEKPAAPEPKETSMAKPAVDPHAGLVKMHKGDQIIHAHPTVVKEHTKNGWTVV